MADDPDPCSAWSLHAAELAVPVVDSLVPWPDGPAAQAMVLDGCLARLGPDLYIPPDVLHGGAVPRILALGTALGRGLRPHHVLGGISAAWVRLGGQPPPIIELISTAHRSALAGAVVRNSRLRPGEVETLAGAPLAAPTRAAFDLLRFEPSARRTAIAGALIAAGHTTGEEIEAGLARMRRHPAASAVRLRLAQAIEIAHAEPDAPAFPPPRAVASAQGAASAAAHAPVPVG